MKLELAEKIAEMRSSLFQFRVCSSVVFDRRAAGVRQPRPSGDRRQRYADRDRPFAGGRSRRRRRHRMTSGDDDVLIRVLNRRRFRVVRGARRRGAAEVRVARRRRRLLTRVAISMDAVGRRTRQRVGRRRRKGDGCVTSVTVFGRRRRSVDGRPRLGVTGSTTTNL